jgi:sporulation protein YtfJ
MTKEIKETNKIKDLMSSSMNDLSDMTDVNAVVGKPIYTPDGTTVIPICKVTMGFMTGGGEYGEVRQLKNDKDSPFAGGSGAVISMKPVGFLTSNNDGVRLISTDKDVYTKLFETAEEFFEKIKK